MVITEIIPKDIAENQSEVIAEEVSRIITTGINKDIPEKIPMMELRDKSPEGLLEKFPKKSS